MKISDLKISLCQMKVTPGSPAKNSAYIINEIKSAKKRGIEIIVFTEMCVTGYLIGDALEDVYFLDDIARANKEIVEATPAGITAIFGTVLMSPGKAGEDGRARIHNGAMIASDGKMIGSIVKSLQPNYRFFNDDKHLYSLRKIAEAGWQDLEDILEPVKIQTAGGKVAAGIILCEDMWHDDYAHNPTKTLVIKGAELIINLSASPWTWQKNRKRHSVVKNLLKDLRVPFIYVNNTGTQNTGKNIIIFDGSSTVYNEAGEIIFEVPPYSKGCHDFTLSSEMPAISQQVVNDTEELYAGTKCATKYMVPAGKHIVVGLSGGIDSATVAAHFVDALGARRVHAINMPFGDLNSKATKDFARQIAENLGISYEVIPIDNAVWAIAKSSGVERGSLAFQNIQARARMEILAAYAQKIGGYFSCNSNKVEMAFGYGTLYGDVAGFYAPLGDKVKREVRQIADHLNKKVFKKEVIPQACVNQIPTAELERNQKDPFDYGDLNRRGYHDEMVRAITEFRKNPEWFLEMYVKGKLEEELLLETGTIKKLFPDDAKFVADLERCWKLFVISYFKRVQCPPIPISSKRAFGRDFEEFLSEPYFTEKFRYLAENVLGLVKAKKERIVIFGGSLDPVGAHHAKIAKTLAGIFDKVIVVPRGASPSKPTIGKASNEQRRQMLFLGLEGIPNLKFDFHDLACDTFTPTYILNERYKKNYQDSEIWFAVGEDIIKGGHQDKSQIQENWINGKEIWESLNFFVISHENSPVNYADLPPHSEVIELKEILGRSTMIRERISKGQSIDGLVARKVAEFIEKEGLYK